MHAASNLALEAVAIHVGRHHRRVSHCVEEAVVAAGRTPSAPPVARHRGVQGARAGAGEGAGAHRLLVFVRAGPGVLYEGMSSWGATTLVSAVTPSRSCRDARSCRTAATQTEATSGRDSLSSLRRRRGCSPVLQRPKMSCEGSTQAGGSL